MPIKLDIGDPKSKKTYHVEAEIENLTGKKLGEKVSGEDIDAKYAGFEFEITGASDKAGFPARKDVEGVGLKGILLKKSIGMNAKRKGLRLRKSIRGNTISADIVQVNLKVLKEGKKSIASILGKEEAPKAEAEETEQKTEPKEQTAEKKEKSAE